jgi:hypothetical protein
MESFFSLASVVLLLLISILVLINSYYINKLTKRNINTSTLIEHKEFVHLKPIIKKFYDILVVDKIVPLLNTELQTFIEENALDKYYLANKDKPEFDVLLNRIVLILKKYIMANSSTTSGNVIQDLLIFLSPENIRYLHQTNIKDVNKNLGTAIGKLF